MFAVHVLLSMRHTFYGYWIPLYECMCVYVCLAWFCEIYEFAKCQMLSHHDVLTIFIIFPFHSFVHSFDFDFRQLLYGILYSAFNIIAIMDALDCSPEKSPLIYCHITWKPRTQLNLMLRI